MQMGFVDVNSGDDVIKGSVSSLETQAESGGNGTLYQFHENLPASSSSNALDQSQDSSISNKVSLKSPRSVKKSLKNASTSGPSNWISERTISNRNKIEAIKIKDSRVNGSKSHRTNLSSSSNSALLGRRNSTGGMTSRQSDPKLNLHEKSSEKKSIATTESPKKSLTERRRSSLSSVISKPSTSSTLSEMNKSSPSLVPRTSSQTDVIKKDPPQRTKKVFESALDNASSRISKKSNLKASFPSVGSPPVTSVSKARTTTSHSGRSSSLTNVSNLKTASPTANGSSLSSRRTAVKLERRDSRFIMLPQVEIKAGDDLRLDLRGHRIRSLGAGGLNLSSTLEFIYLRDNLLSSLEGIDALSRVKVLDLSFNDFKGNGFEPLENCKALQQLYLAGNKITSLTSLPQLPNLEFLSVAQNKLKSLSMSPQPRLQVLAASKNKISTLKGFPHLPLLEHLRVEENPILEVPHLEAASILLVGPTLKKFNDRDLSCGEIEIAKKYPAHTALCIRDGWELCPPELAADSSFHFLVDRWKDHLPPGFTLKDASVDEPFEEDVCRCHFVFMKDCSLGNGSELLLKYQWLVGERTPVNFEPISDAVGEVYRPRHDDIGKCLKIECTPIFEGVEYPSIFAVSLPVAPGNGCPKILNLSVHGNLVEGNVIKGYAEVAWCGATPGKSVSSWLRRKWNSSPFLIAGAEDEEYRLTIDDVDSALVFMYTPVTEEGCKGEPQYAMTDFVKAAPPSISNVHILGDTVEGNTIKGTGEYFGGKEGPSNFEWLREDKETGVFVLVSSGTPEYTLTKEDAGKWLTFVYIPINLEGKEGESVSVVSDIIKQAPPKVINLKIVGDLREGNKITVTSTVTGGTEGSSKVQWFKTSNVNFEGENGLEALSTSKTAKAFRIPLSAVGYYIVAKFIPMDPVGESGEPAYVVSEKAVETLPPSLNFLTVTGDYSEGEILTASYGYVGGYEGKSLYSWYLHENQSDPGSLIPDASGTLQYRIAKEAIGKFISFKCTLVRDDGAVGEPRIYLGQERVRSGAPRLLSLQIVGKPIEGAILHVQKKYWGGEEGASIYHWFLTNEDGTQNEVKGAIGSNYTVSNSDIGFLISVSCEPVRSDGVCGPVIVSEQIGPVIPGPPTCHSLEFVGSMMEGHELSFNIAYSGGEKGNCKQEWFRVKTNGVKEKLSDDEFLGLTLEDVGGSIELVYTPTRKDGLIGNRKKIISGIIMPADPVGLELTIPDCFEDEEVIPHILYYGGWEGDRVCTWFRTKKKLQASDLINILNGGEDIISVARTLTYIPSLEDVGSYLTLYWMPTRSDGKSGKPLFTISPNPVFPAFPLVSDVCIREISFGVFAGEGKYHGGHEGTSFFSWYRESSDGSVDIITGANSITYEVTDSDYNYRLLFGYTPVRSDMQAGEMRLSKATDIILPEPLKIQMLTLNGKAIEGETLTAVNIIPVDEAQRIVWEKYKKDVSFQWYLSSEFGEKDSFEPFPSQRSSSYKVRYENIGRCLRCECIVRDIFGRSSESVSVVSSPVLPGIPKMEKLEIEGRGFHTNLYAVRGTYIGGREGKSRIQWLRAMIGSPDLISIPGETGRMYEANVDDVGYRLVVVYTPVRDDGVEGQPVSASTEPIAIEPDVHKEVKQKMDLGAVKFETLCDRDLSTKKASDLGSLERRVLEVNKKRVKVVKPGSKTSFPTTEIRGSYTPPFHVEVFRNDQHRLKIVVDSNNEIELMVQTRHTRDIIYLVIRGFAHKFNSTSLNSLLQIET